MVIFYFMLIRSKIKIIIGKIFFIFYFFIYVYNIVFAGSASEGLNTTADIGYGGSAPIQSLPEAIGRFVGAILAFVGVAFLILMIYGGFTWMTARGNEQEVEKAKDLITQAIIGLVIVLSAYAITAYVSDIIFGV